MCPDAQLQRTMFRRFVNISFPNREPLHTPRARVCVRPSSTALQSQLPQQATSHKGPPVTCIACKQGPSLRHHWCIAIAKASHLSPKHGLVFRCSTFGTGGVALHDVAASVVGSDSAGVRLETVLPSQLLARRTQGLTRFPPGNSNTISSSL
jgi:hypothetical protein